MMLFIDTSVFVDVLRVKQVESSKSLFKSLQEENTGFTSATSISLGIQEIVTRDIEHFNRMNGIKAVTPEELSF